LSDPKFGQKMAGFRMGPWVQIKQQCLIICCCFLPLVQGLLDQYFNICPSGLSDGILFLVSSALELFLLVVFSIPVYLVGENAW
jgi:hypothetical protein